MFYDLPSFCASLCENKGNVACSGMLLQKFKALEFLVLLYGRSDCIETARFFGYADGNAAALACEEAVPHLLLMLDVARKLQKAQRQSWGWHDS